MKRCGEYPSAHQKASRTVGRIAVTLLVQIPKTDGDSIRRFSGTTVTAHPPMIGAAH
jgi:hypothetical protein